MPTTLLCHISTHRETARKLESVCVLGFGPTGISQLCDQLENIGWTSSVMSLKKILAKTFANNIGRVSSVMSLQKYWQKYLPKKLGLIGDEFQTDRKWLWVGRSGYGCSYSVQLLEAFSPVEVVWTGRGGVVLCKRIGCSLLQAIFSLNLVFGVANRGFQVFWNNKDYLLASFFLQQEPLVLQPCG